MYNNYGISTIVLDDSRYKACYYYAAECEYLYCTMGGENISEFLESISADEYSAKLVKERIQQAWEVIQQTEEELTVKIITAEPDPLLCPFDLIIHNDDETSIDYVRDIILQSTLNIDSERAEELVNEIHNNESAIVETYQSYEVAHLFLTLIYSINSQTDNYLNVTIAARHPQNFLSLYHILDEANYI